MSGRWAEFLLAIEDYELRAQLAAVPGDRYCLPAIFQLRDNSKKTRKYVEDRLRWMRALDPWLVRALAPGEEVRFVTRCSVSFPSTAPIGFVSPPLAYGMTLMYRALAVFTDRRMLLAWTFDGQTPAGSFCQVEDRHLRTFKKQLLAGCAVTPVDNAAFTLGGISKDEFQRLETARAENPPVSVEAPPAGYDAIIRLCTNCLGPVPRKTYECPACAERFMKPWKCGWMNLLPPFLGELYRGYRRPWALLAALFLVVLGIIAFLAAMLAADGKTAEALIAGGILAVVMLLFLGGAGVWYGVLATNHRLTSARAAWGRVPPFRDYGHAAPAAAPAAVPAAPQRAANHRPYPYEEK